MISNKNNFKTQDCKMSRTLSQKSMDNFKIQAWPYILSLNIDTLTGQLDFIFFVPWNV